MGDLFSIPGLGRSPGGGHGSPLQCSYLENPQVQRILAGYSPWGHKELDMTERLNTQTHRPITPATVYDNILMNFGNCRKSCVPPQPRIDPSS